MIGISKLYCGTVEPSDPLRYGRKAGKLPSHLLQFSQDKKPIVVWNCTRRCNLKCVHCYSQSADKDYDNELSTDQGLALLEDLAEFGVPVVLFSGGEPLLRANLNDTTGLLLNPTNYFAFVDRQRQRLFAIRVFARQHRLD